jgi:hypothetical protein
MKGEMLSNVALGVNLVFSGLITIGLRHLFLNPCNLTDVVRETVAKTFPICLSLSIPLLANVINMLPDMEVSVARGTQWLVGRFRRTFCSTLNGILILASVITSIFCLVAVLLAESYPFLNSTSIGIALVAWMDEASNGGMLPKFGFQPLLNDFTSGMSLGPLLVAWTVTSGLAFKESYAAAKAKKSKKEK